MSHSMVSICSHGSKRADQWHTWVNAPEKLNGSENIVEPNHGPSRTDASISIHNIMNSQSLDVKNVQPSTLPLPVDLTYLRYSRLMYSRFKLLLFERHFSQNKSPKKFKAIPWYMVISVVIHYAVTKAHQQHGICIATKPHMPLLWQDCESLSKLILL